MKTSAGRLRGPALPQVVAEARNGLIRKLHADGVPGVFSEESRPLAPSLIAGVLGIQRSAVTRALARRPEPEPDPDPAPAAT